MSANAKLTLCAAVIAATLAYLAYLGASSSWQYYVLVDECVAQADELHGKRLLIRNLKNLRDQFPDSPVFDTVDELAVLIRSFTTSEA